MNRSLATAIIALALIAAAVAYIATRSPSTASRERTEAGWRICAACGHTWHMDLAEIQRQTRQDPEGNGWVQCPNCAAWRGLPVMRCPKCNTLYGAYTIDETGAQLGKCRTCPHCGHTLGADQPDTTPQPDDTD